MDKRKAKGLYACWLVTQKTVQVSKYGQLLVELDQVDGDMIDQWHLALGLVMHVQQARQLAPIQEPLWAAQALHQPTAADKMGLVSGSEQ